MEEEQQKWLKMEIQHIFDSGANETRIFEMVKSFIEHHNAINGIEKEFEELQEIVKRLYHLMNRNDLEKALAKIKKIREEIGC